MRPTKIHFIFISFSIASSVLASGSMGAAIPIDSDSVCVLLSGEPASPQDKSMYVGFGTQGADYFFAGIAEVAQVQGEPLTNENNRVVYDSQAARFSNDEGLSYLSQDVSLTLDPNRREGVFDAQVTRNFFTTPPLKLNASIRKVLPIGQCLSKSQLEIRILIAGTVDESKPILEKTQ